MSTDNLQPCSLEPSLWPLLRLSSGVTENASEMTLIWQSSMAVFCLSFGSAVYAHDDEEEEDDDDDENKKLPTAHKVNVDHSTVTSL